MIIRWFAFGAAARGRLVTYGDRTLLCIAPRLWNKLPLDLRQVMSTSVFVRHLVKTYLFARDDM
jgi:hypothetical protein